MAKGYPADPDANPIVLFTATVGWLRSMTPAAIQAGYALIYNYLKNHGYTATQTFDTQNFTTTITITIVPKDASANDFMAGAVPPYILKDWQDALNADAKDKPIDKGIIPGAPKKALSQLKQEARQYLQNKGIAANGY